MAMKSKIFQDENHCYQFDFTDAIWVTDELHDTFQKNKASILSDVDFIAETENEIILLEYKNASISSAVKPERFVPSDQKRLNKIAYKYYDSWIFLKAIGKNKPIRYIYILEYPKRDTTTRKAIRNKIIDLLPFELQRLPLVKQKLILEFEVLSINEWNLNEKYKNFPITPVTME